jgi:hypothetical protein
MFVEMTKNLTEIRQCGCYLDQFLVVVVKAAVDCRYLLVVVVAAAVVFLSYLVLQLRPRFQDLGILGQKVLISGLKSFVCCCDLKPKICCHCDLVGVHLQKKCVCKNGFSTRYSLCRQIFYRERIIKVRKRAKETRGKTDCFLFNR